MGNEVKAGWKTSEFWVSAVGSIVTLVDAHIVGLPVESILSVAGMVIGYVFSRTVVKAKSKTVVLQKEL